LGLNEAAVAAAWRGDVDRLLAERIWVLEPTPSDRSIEMADLSPLRRAEDFVHFVEAFPGESDRGPAIFHVETRSIDRPVCRGGMGRSSELQEKYARVCQIAVAETVGYSGKLVFDTSKPDGTRRKLLDSSLILSSTLRNSRNGVAVPQTVTNGAWSIPFGTPRNMVSRSSLSEKVRATVCPFLQC
jgi:hypothetical protein